MKKQLCSMLAFLITGAKEESIAEVLSRMSEATRNMFVGEKL